MSDTERTAAAVTAILFILAAFVVLAGAAWFKWQSHKRWIADFEDDCEKEFPRNS